MDEGIRIREASPEDIPALLSLEERIFSDPWRAEDFNVVFRYRHYGALVAEKAGEILGYLVFSLILPEGNIDNVAVSEETRQHGIGGALVEQALRYAKEQGTTRMMLEVREGNAPARNLYEKLGFTPFSRREGYYQDPTEDAILYEKLI